MRRQSECPGCRQRSAVFWLRHSSGEGIYRCADPLCGWVFRGAHPEPRPARFTVPVVEVRKWGPKYAPGLVEETIREMRT